MAIFRTPVASFHTDVSFIQNGELGTEGVLNRPLFALDDKAQFLKETQDSEITKGSALASKLGEVYDTGVAPLWNTPVNFSQGVAHHIAIEKLDAAVNVLQTGTNFARVDNIDTFLIGEDSTSGTNPDWTDGATYTPTFITVGDTHHQALVRLDSEAGTARTDITALLANVVVLQGQVNNTIGPDLTSAQGAISLNTTNIANLTALTTTHTGQIVVLDASMVNAELSIVALDTRLDVEEAFTAQASCLIETFKTQINELRADHGRVALVYGAGNICPP